MNEIIDYGIKYGLPIIFAVIAIWQIKARLNIQKLLQQESIHLHSSVALVLHNCQAARDTLLQGQMPNALAIIGQAEGGTQMLLKQTVKLVCHYYNPTYADIDEWVKSGKIVDHYKPMYLSHANNNRGWFRTLYKLVERNIV